MKIYEGYVLASELTAKAKRSTAWIHETESINVDYMGSTPVVEVASLKDKYKEIAKQCQDLRNFYTFAAFSIEIGRAKEFMNVMKNQRAKENKPDFETLKINRYRLLKLSDEFLDLVN
jgi:hypothetical protein